MFCGCRISLSADLPNIQYDVSGSPLIFAVCLSLFTHTNKQTNRCGGMGVGWICNTDAKTTIWALPETVSILTVSLILKEFWGQNIHNE